MPRLGLWALLVGVAVAASGASGASPGVVVNVGESLVNYVARTAMPPIVRALQGLQLPDMTGSQHVPVVGEVDWTISGLTVADAAIDGTAAAFSGDGLDLVISGLALKITADFKVREHAWPHITSSGSVDIKLSGSSGLDVAVDLLESGGRLQVAAGGIDANLDDVSIKVHGSLLSWLYDLILDIAKGTIVHDAEAAVGSELGRLINTTANAALDKVDYKVPLGKLLLADFSLPSPPVTVDGYAMVPSLGCVEIATAPQPSPVPHAGLPATPTGDFLGIYADSYLINSLTTLAYDFGLIKLAPITGKLLVSSSSILAGFAPGLAAAFPGDQPLQVVVSASAAPLAAVTSKGAGFRAPLTVQWNARNGTNGTFVPAFTLALNVSTDLTVAAKTRNTTVLVVPQVAYLDLDVATVSSQVGTVNFAPVVDLLENLAVKPLLSKLNAALAEGIELPPVPGVTLVSPTIEERDGYWRIATNFTIDPPVLSAEAVRRDRVALGLASA